MVLNKNACVAFSFSSFKTRAKNIEQWRGINCQSHKYVAYLFGFEWDFRHRARGAHSSSKGERTDSKLVKTHLIQFKS